MGHGDMRDLEFKITNNGRESEELVKRSGEKSNFNSYIDQKTNNRQ